MRGGSFRTRIVALITALVLGAQAVTLLAVTARGNTLQPAIRATRMRIALH